MARTPLLPEEGWSKAGVVGAGDEVVGAADGVVLSFNCPRTPPTAVRRLRAYRNTGGFVSPERLRLSDKHVKPLAERKGSAFPSAD